MSFCTLLVEGEAGYNVVCRAPFVKQHMDNMHRSTQQAGCNMTENSYTDGCLNSCCDYPPAGARDKKYLTPAALLASSEALQRGLAATSDQSVYNLRVQKVYMTVLYPILWNWEAVLKLAVASKKIHILPPTQAAAFDTFAGIYRRVKVRTFDGQQNHEGCINECPLTWMRAQLGLNASSAREGHQE